MGVCVVVGVGVMVGVSVLVGVGVIVGVSVLVGVGVMVGVSVGVFVGVLVGVGVAVLVGVGVSVGVCVLVGVGVGVFVGVGGAVTATLRANSEVFPALSVVWAVRMSPTTTPLTAIVKLPLLSAVPWARYVLPSP